MDTERTCNCNPDDKHSCQYDYGFDFGDISDDIDFMEFDNELDS